MSDDALALALKAKAANDALAIKAAFRTALAAATPEVASASPPTMSLGYNNYTIGGAAIQAPGVAANSASIRTIGGTLKASNKSGSSGAYLCASVDIANGIYTQDGWALEFETDAPNVEIGLRRWSQYCRFAVDGQYVSLTNYDLGGADSAFVIPKLALGSSRPRRIRVELTFDNDVYGVTVAPYYRVWRPAAKKPTFMVFGDSFVEATGATIRSALGRVRNGFAWQLARLIGVENDTIVSGWGGTGFLNNATTKKTYRQRINDIISAAPDGVLVFGGQNDGLVDPSALQTETTAFFTQLKAALPSSVIVFAGAQRSPTPNTIPSANNAALQAGAAAAGIPVFDVYNMTSGNTYNQTGTQDGNNYWYVGGDGIHPSQLGHNYHANRLAAAWRNLIAA